MSHETDKTKVINEVTYTALRMPPMYSTPLFFKLVRFIAPMLKGLDGIDLEGMKDIKEEVGLGMLSEVLMKLDPEESSAMIEGILTNGYVWKEGKEIKSLDEVDGGCPIELIQVFVFVCQFQFGGSLAKMGKFKKLAAIMGNLQKQ